MSMLSAQVDELRELAGDGSMEWVTGPIRTSVLREAADTIWELRDDLQRANAENAKLREEFDKMDVWHSKALSAAMAEVDKLREQLERVQPTDCEGNVLDIADTVHMLRSEYDGDHEWEDVVTELVLTKWGGDRWIVRGSKGEAWACDCTKTGYDEDAYEASDDVEPFDEPTLLEVENAKLRELVLDLYCLAYPSTVEWEVSDATYDKYSPCEKCQELHGGKSPCASTAKDMTEECCAPIQANVVADRMRELGVEVEW